MRDVTFGLLLVAGLGVSRFGAADDGWDRAAAARYLDARADQWTKFARERQKLETACISCHTAMPYLLSRGALLTSDSKPEQPRAMRALFGDVEKRVAGFESARVWYDESRGAEKPDQSRGTESVLNALVLTLRDRDASVALGDVTKTALRHMWSQQKADGHWSWLHFGLGPWETDGSDYWGAALAAVASASAGDEAPAPPQKLSDLRRYLRAGLEPGRDLSLHNRLALLWASSVWPDLLSGTERAGIVDDVLAAQRPDGGFRLADLGAWHSNDGTPPSEVSDGYATGFTVFVLQSVHAAGGSESVARGLVWLERNQKADGQWETLSPNKDRSGEDDLKRLLASDAATAFAVLALSQADRSH